MSLQQRALSAFGRYVTKNPQEIARTLRDLLGFRLGAPLDVLRFLLEEAERGGKLKNAELSEVPPGFRFSGSLEAMKTPLYVSAIIYIDRMVVNADEIRVELRLEDIELKVEGDSVSPIAALIKSGALDLSKPGNLMKNFPLPSFIVDAKDNRITLDLLKHKKLRNNEALKRVLRLITPFVTAQGIESDDDHVSIRMRPLPKGIFEAARAVRSEIIHPGVTRIKGYLPL